MSMPTTRVNYPPRKLTNESVVLHGLWRTKIDKLTQVSWPGYTREYTAPPVPQRRYGEQQSFACVFESNPDGSLVHFNETVIVIAFYPFACVLVKLRASIVGRQADSTSGTYSRSPDERWDYGLPRVGQRGPALPGSALFAMAAAAASGLPEGAVASPAPGRGPETLWIGIERV